MSRPDARVLSQVVEHESDGEPVGAGGEASTKVDAGRKEHAPSGRFRLRPRKRCSGPGGAGNHGCLLPSFDPDAGYIRGMKIVRTLALSALLVCAAPMISVFVAAAIASHYGCTLHEGFVNPCVVAGRDIGQSLYTMGVMGWMMLFTLPIGALVLAAWIGIEIVARVRRART